MQRPLDPFVAICMNGRDHLQEQRRGGWDVEAAPEHHHVVKQRPQRAVSPSLQSITHRDQSRILCLSLPQPVDEVETWG